MGRRPLLPLLAALVCLANAAPRPIDDEVAADKELVERRDTAVHRLFKRQTPKSSVAIGSLIGDDSSLHAAALESRRKRATRSKRQAYYEPTIEDELSALSDQELAYLADLIDELQGDGDYYVDDDVSPFYRRRRGEEPTEMLYVLPTSDDYPLDYDQQPDYDDQYEDYGLLPIEDEESDLDQNEMAEILDEIELRERIGELAQLLSDRYTL